MIFYVTALLPEAKPIIEKHCMKRIPGENKYQIFAGDVCFLIVTGTGGINAMAAVTYLLTRFSTQKTDLLINIGVCAAFASGNEIDGYRGMVFLARSIFNYSFSRSSYPDMIYKTPFHEADVVTVPDLYRKGNISVERMQSFQKISAFNRNSADVPLLIEMEAAYIYEAALRFLYSHNIFILKIVSDDGETGKVTKEAIYGLVDTNIIALSDFVQKLKVFNESGTDTKTAMEFPEYEQMLIDKIIDDLRLTKYQQNEIRKLAHFCLLREKPLGMILEGAADPIKIKTKMEGKILYERLRSRLIEP